MTVKVWPTTRRGSLVAAIVALLVAALLLIGGRGTFAYWNDDAAVSGGTFSSGKLDLTVDGAQGNPTAFAETNLALATMVPGESVAANVVLANAGDADFTWTASASAGGDLGPALTVEVFLGSQSGDDTTYPRTESCSGTAITLGGTATRLNRTQTQAVCVEVSLPTTTGNAFQSKTTGSVTVTVNATQVIS